MFDKKFKLHFYWPLFWVTVSLSVIGLVNLYSATYNITDKTASSLFYSQLLWFLIGIAGALLLLLIDYRVFMALSYPLYGLVIFLLIMVIFFGKEIAGNRNWIQIGPVNVQPSEFAKIALILAFSKYMSDNPPKRGGYDFVDLIIPVLIMCVPLAFILLGKDIGTSLFIILLCGTFILFSGVKRYVVILAVVLGLVGSLGAYHKFFSDRQKARILTFMNPDTDPKGLGYHLIQSKITVGSGEIFGQGYLKGMHNKLEYLPERHTDFIFPVLAEEWGFVGCFVVLALYLSLLIMGIQTMTKAKENFGIYLALGVTALFFWQIVINLGGVLGLMPLTGVTLPLLSYGGSSLVSILVGVSFLLNISLRRFMF